MGPKFSSEFVKQFAKIKKRQRKKATPQFALRGFISQKINFSQKWKFYFSLLRKCCEQLLIRDTCKRFIFRKRFIGLLITGPSSFPELKNRLINVVIRDENLIAAIMLRFAGSRFARQCIKPTLRVPLFTQKQELSGLTIGVLKEQETGENRVAVVPAHVEQLVKKGAKVQVQAGAGEKSGFRDEQYVAAGAEIAKEDDVWKNELVIKIRPPKPVLIFNFK